MKTFWNRTTEQERLRAFLSAPGGGLAIVYGRRRCGKSTLLQRVLDPRAVYFQADQIYSIMSLIGGGCHRVSEIAGRLGKPMPSLMRPLAQLCELGYVRRDVPFGENPKNSKRSLYRLQDSFLRFYFRFVLPYESALAQGLFAETRRAWRATRVQHVAACWEDLSRISAPWFWSGER